MRAVLLLLLLGCADDPPPTTGEVSEQPFSSEVVEDDYLLRVRLPPEGDGPFPLILQLDPTFVGLQQFALSAGFVSQHAAAGDWPEAGVVGVDYPDPFTRQRDYTPEEPLDPDFGNGGADAFDRVLRDEVLPHLQETLPVDPERLEAQVAALCQQLLERGLLLQQGERQRPLRAGDLCLMVSRHDQAEALRSALEQQQLPSRLVSRGDVFTSPGAAALQRLLDALASPGLPSRQRLLAASALLGGCTTIVGATLLVSVLLEKRSMRSAKSTRVSSFIQ
jgi:hypothetical protein